MASGDRKDRPEPDVLRTVVVAYHIVSDLTRPETTLDTLRVAQITNGILERLREAWKSLPVFLAAISEQDPVVLKQPKTTADSDAINKQLWTLLIVLKAACRSFLQLYGQPRKRQLGFIDTEEDES